MVRESEPSAAGVTPPKRAAPVSEGDLGARGQAEPGYVVSVATGNLHIAGNREAMAPGHSPSLLAQPSFIPATPGATGPMCLVQYRAGVAQEADEVDRADPEWGHERRELLEE